MAISPQSPDQSLSTVEKADLEFTVLSDPGNRVADRVGIVFQQADEVLEAQRKLGLDLAQVNAEGSTSCPGPPSSSSTRTALSVSWTSSPTTGPHRGG